MIHNEVQLEDMMLMLLCLATIAVFPAVAFSEETKLGKPVDVAAATSISDILAQPETYLGRTVRIEGEVMNVCPEMGCWMEVRDPQTRKSIRVKVDDGQIVFPKTAQGRTTEDGLHGWGEGTTPPNVAPVVAQIRSLGPPARSLLPPSLRQAG